MQLRSWPTTADETHVTEREVKEAQSLCPRLPAYDLSHCPRRGEGLGRRAVVLPGEYGRLLHIGLCSGPDFHPDDEEMLLRLAEPWFEAIRTRAGRDGLKVHCYLGWDMYTQTHSACAALCDPTALTTPTCTGARSTRG